MNMSEKVINIEFTRDEALVLLEWLNHFDEAESIPVQDDAEQKVLWSLEGKLEKALVEVVKPEYKELVAKAKERLLSD
jgi:hypothetical protein